ncbi:hypothetical protein [Marinitenerispora sediminis]|uniref:DUF8083 domain-containing protein n=1 Tax=Marinitenerispora sediminis TaxID=1931232 RepID=A0A368T3S7_9ACTN|nr:hypothetical protein [Marinitenerispora sediminis]RCV53008.1 hypothetical protein DEF23_18290 [Marinitenerispora sediminis]RCV57211.1 hypothetical protein DEF24_15530 [Marinitenerispora sediminis]RCV57254.1 hypothetical protein DEF28_01850 [Marinitenerispora sediminis]
MLPYTAYLRVYQPIAAFSSRDQAYWRAYADSPDRPRRVEAVAAEHAESLRRIVATPPIAVPEHESGDAYVRRVGRELYVCPWQTRLRSWLAFREFRTATPARVSAAFVPEAVARSAELGFARWQERGEQLRTRILTSTWTVPLSWFLPFAPAERCLVLDAAPGRPAALDDTAAPHHLRGPAQPAGDRPDRVPAPREATRAMLYVADVAEARRRLGRAVSVLRGSVGEGVLLTAAEQLEDWLSAVAHPRGLLELDYGGLVHLLDDAGLRADESVAEVAAAVTGLENGQEELAMAMYHRLTRRWRAVQALEHAN